MGLKVKNPFIFSILATVLLAGCGGEGAGTPTPDTSPVTFSKPEEKPEIEADVTTLGGCKTLPGEWEFQDVTTGAHITPPTVTPSLFQKKFQKSWGGTTTAHAVWEMEAADEPVWNEGRTVHFGSGGSFTTYGMITSIHLSGTPGNMTELIGTDDGLVIADIVRDNNTWKLKQQKTVAVMGPVRSVAMTPLILEKNGAHVPMVFMVAGDSVYIAKLADLRAGGGCVAVAYQAKDHPVDPKDPANKRTFRPIKVVAQHSYAAFITASRLPEEFANMAQFKSVLQNEWTSFQSTAHLIDLARRTPVEPIITTMGEFDRFFASDIGIADTAVYLYGSRYRSSKPTTAESGLAIYKALVGTPVVASWAAVPASIGGDFRMGRFDTNLATAYIRGLDKAAKVDNFLSGPTQQKWSGWKEALPFDYVRGVSYRLSLEKNTTDPKKWGQDQRDDMAVETPQFVANGPMSRNWSQLISGGITYTPITTIVNATSTDVDYVDVQGRVVHQHMQDDGRAVFPITPLQPTDPNLPKVPDISTDPFAPRLFHTGNLIFFVRHSGDSGPFVYVYPDAVTGDVDVGDTKNNPALLGFWVDGAGKFTKGITFSAKAIAGFADIPALPPVYRIDDIRELSNPLAPQYRHFAMLIHAWDGKVNIYRVVIIQMNLKPANPNDRMVEIQGCSDIQDPSNNYSNNVSYGNPDEQPRFMGAFQVASNDSAAIRYVGYFQHYSPTYNVWKASMTVTVEPVVEGQTKGLCKSAGELTPITDPVAAESLAAALNDNSIIGLHTNGLVRWKLDAKTTQYYDVGNNLLGGAVALQKSRIISADNQFITQMDTTDGFHPTAIFNLDGTVGESCPSCQFTDLSTAGVGTVATHPERGIELYNFTGN